jgi:repressor LexA
MIKIGIHDGDLLAVHKTEQAIDGDIIVARIDEDVTVKRLLRGNNKYSLQLIAENDDFSPIEVDLRSQQFTIEGVSVGVIRRGL